MSNDFSTDTLIVKVAMLKGEKGDKGDRGDIDGAYWGGITGNLRQQADLDEALTDIEDALDEKLDIADAQSLTTTEIDDIIEEA